MFPHEIYRSQRFPNYFSLQQNIPKEHLPEDQSGKAAVAELRSCGKHKLVVGEFGAGRYKTALVASCGVCW